ncbi:MAG: CHAD domain-containing protein [Myxococcales bacterium]
MNAPRLLAGRIEAVQKHEGGLPSAEAVHDMRVALRRLRAALRLLRLRELDPPVKELQDALGQVRDLQLQIEWLAGRPPSRRRTAALRKAERALEPALAKWRDRTLPALLDAARKAKAPDASRRRQILRKRLRRFEERLEAALARPTPRAMHRVRISVKQIRYLFEIEKGPAAKLLLAELPPLQESLGQLHDMDVRAMPQEKAARAQLASIVKTQLQRWKNRDIIGIGVQTVTHRL